MAAGINEIYFRAVYINKARFLVSDALLGGVDLYGNAMRCL